MQTVDERFLTTTRASVMADGQAAIDELKDAIAAFEAIPVSERHTETTRTAAARVQAARAQAETQRARLDALKRGGIAAVIRLDVQGERRTQSRTQIH